MSATINLIAVRPNIRMGQNLYMSVAGRDVRATQSPAWRHNPML